MSKREVISAIKRLNTIYEVVVEKSEKELVFEFLEKHFRSAGFLGFRDDLGRITHCEIADLMLKALEGSNSDLIAKFFILSPMGCFGVKEETHRSAVLLIDGISSLTAARKLDKIATFASLNFSQDKSIRYREDAYPEGVTFDLSNYMLYDSLSASNQFLIQSMTEKSIEKSKDMMLPKNYRELLDAALAGRTSGYKSWARSNANLRRLLFHFNLSDISEVTKDHIKQWMLYTFSDGSWHRHLHDFKPIIKALSGVSVSDVTAKINYEKSITVGSTKVGRKRSTNVKIPDGYSYASETLCRLLRESRRNVIFSHANERSVVKIGNWEIASADLYQYKPDLLNDENYTNSFWSSTQADFLNSQNYEKSTKRMKSRALMHLNYYIFSYLKSFYLGFSGDHVFPGQPRDFHGALYTHKSDTVKKHLYRSSDAKFPMIVADFVEVLQKKSARSKSSARDILATLRQYFDFVITRYSSIDKCKLEANPFSAFDSVRGEAAPKKVKTKKIDFEYWLYFQAYVLHLLEALIEYAEDDQNGNYESSDIPLNVEFKTLGEKLVIGNVEHRIDGDIFLSPIEINTNGLTRSIPNLFDIGVYLVMATTGLRQANVLWIDARNFDEGFDDSLDDGMYSEIFVSADKTKTEGFYSATTAKVIRLMRRIRNIRKKLVDIPYEPIPYNDDSESKWGEILPLFQSRPSNITEYKKFKLLLLSFEKFMRDNSLQLKSVFRIAHYDSETGDISDAKDDKGSFINEYRIRASAGDFVPFSPVKMYSDISPHSLRVTFDSFMSVMTDEETVGRIFTGQGAVTVGSYTKNTPLEEMSVKALASKAGITIAPVSQSENEKELIVEKLKEKGLSGASVFTISGIGKEKPIDNILKDLSREEWAINKTHICPYNNICPDDILVDLGGKKNCALCPASISTVEDGPAIAALIKKLCDEVADINEELEKEGYNKSERRELMDKRLSITKEACSWIVRHKYLNSILESEQFGVFPGGEDRVKSTLKYMEPGSPEVNILSRLIEVENAPALQSERLKKEADRMSRILVKKIKDGAVDFRRHSPVELAASLIRKIANINEIPVQEIPKIAQQISVQTRDEGNLLLEVS